MPKSSRISPRAFLTRVHLLTIFMLVAGLGILGRLSVLQVKDYSAWLAKAASQQQGLGGGGSKRGEILWAGKDGVLQPAATNQHIPYVWAAPKEIINPKEASKTLAPILGIPEAMLFTKLSKPNDSYEVLTKKVSNDAISALQSFHLKGIYIDTNEARLYPSGSLGSHVLGFISGDETGNIAGRYGVEASYDGILRGNASDTATAFLSRTDTNGKSLVGSNIVLTIDPNIQFESERLLAEGVQKWHAKSGTIIVIESQTGRILALANQPTFDPNAFGKMTDASIFLNRAISLRYEPGSVFKAFTMSAGLESGAVTATSTYYDSGEFNVDGYTIRNAGNSAPHQLITMSMLLERSYNVGAATVASRVGSDYLRNFLLNNFGFEEKSGIDLPGEIKNDFGNLKPPVARAVNFATAAFGQGIALTPIKLIQAFNAFADGGYLLKPYVVDRIVHPDGSVDVKDPTRFKQVVPQATLDALTPMLESVVEGERGSGWLARIPGYHIAGKTGTGDISKADTRGYYTNQTNHTFIGFGPVTNPRVTILVRLEDPVGVRYAEATAVPMFHDLMKFVLDYYGIPPDDPAGLNSPPPPSIL